MFVRVKVFSFVADRRRILIINLGFCLLSNDFHALMSADRSIYICSKMLKRLLSRAHMMLIVVIGLLLIFFILLFLLIFHCPCRVFLHAHTWSFTSLTAGSGRCDGLRIIESVHGGQKSLILFMRFVIGFAARSLATCIFAYLCMSVEATQIHCTC